MSEIDVNKCDFYHTCSDTGICCIDCETCQDKPNCYYKQLQQANKKLEKIKEIIKTDVENEDITLQEFSKIWYFSLSPKGKILQDILNIIKKSKRVKNNENRN